MLHGILSQGINVETKNQVSNVQTKNHTAPSITGRIAPAIRCPRRGSFSVAQLHWPLKLVGPLWNPGGEPTFAFWPWISLLFDLWISSDYGDSWSPAVSHSTPFTKASHIIWVEIFLEQLLTVQESGWKYGLNKVKLIESEFHIYHWAVTIYKTRFTNPRNRDKNSAS